MCDDKGGAGEAIRPQAVAPSSRPANNTFLLLRATGLMRFSTLLVSISTRPSARNTRGPSQWSAM